MMNFKKQRKRITIFLPVAVLMMFLSPGKVVPVVDGFVRSTTTTTTTTTSRYGCEITKTSRFPPSNLSTSINRRFNNHRPSTSNRSSTSQLHLVNYNNLSTIASTFQSTFHSNPSYVLTAILWLSSFGTSLERRTVVGKALSAPLATMAVALLVANLGVIPFQSPVYSMVNRFLVPLAVPLLLFDSDLKRVINDTGTLLAAFGVGAFATVVGTIVAFPLIPLRSLGPDVGWRVACGRYKKYNILFIISCHSIYGNNQLTFSPWFVVFVSASRSAYRRSYQLRCRSRNS
jgi:hypothetical protein